MGQTIKVECDKCNGYGEIERDLGIIGAILSPFVGDFEKKCSKCNGSGYMNVYKEDETNARKNR